MSAVYLIKCSQYRGSPANTNKCKKSIELKKLRFASLHTYQILFFFTHIKPFTVSSDTLADKVLVSFQVWCKSHVNREEYRSF